MLNDFLNDTLFLNGSNFSTATVLKPHPPTEGGVLSGHGPLESALARFLVQATIIIGLSRFLHIFLRKLKQPRVIAEIVGGICLGPSVLGNIPGFTEAIFKKDSLPFLATVSNIGLVFYLFLVGLELEPQAFFNHVKQSAAISAAGIILPFVLGVAGSYGMYTYLLVPNVNNIPFTSFLLFTGVAMSITAFPVLARILSEKKLFNTSVGLVAISAAAMDDATAWTLLALVISILNAQDNMTALYVFLLALGYSLLLLVGLRPLFGMLFNRFLAKSTKPISQFFVAAVFMCIFISAWITELIGVHAIFGAFLMGLIIPRNNNMAIRLTEKIEDVIVIGFLPLFFASSGLKTNIGLLNDGTTWLWLFVVIFIACFGKMFGCTMVAKLTGVGWREAFSVGVLMNTKGLVELIVLNIGYDAKVINDRIFLIMVIMALVTTFMTSPIIAYIYPPKYQKVISHKPPRVLSVASMQPSTVTAIDEQIRVLVCLDEYLPVPIVAKLLWLFRTGSAKSEQLIINTLKLVETSERSSSILLGSQIAEAVRSDPDLNMMSLFGSLINVPTRNFMALSPADEVSEEVNYLANTEECNLIVMSWFDQTVYNTIMSSSPQEKVRSVVRTAAPTTAVYAPLPTKTSGQVPVATSILVPFFEGRDDCEALKVALRFRRHGDLNITVLMVSNAVPNTNPSRSAWGSTVAEERALIAEAERVSSEDSKFSFRKVQVTNRAAAVVDECHACPFDLVVLGRNDDDVSHPVSPQLSGVVSVSGALQRSKSEVQPPGAKELQRTLSAEFIRSELKRASIRAPKVNISTEVLGKLGQTLYESQLSSVLVVHRNNIVHT